MIILIVEDQDKRFFSIIKRLKQLLNEIGAEHTVSVKNNYFDALNYYKENSEKIILVLIDVRMPNGDNSENIDDTRTGIKLFNEIKKINKDQKILFWTILKKEELIEMNVDLEDADYIEKTADYSRFFAKIDNKLGTEMNDLLNDKLYR